MIPYQKFTLDNGLEVLVHEDHTTKMAVLNLLYKVGSRNENPGKTGLAHYFEHLMFGGSKHVPVFDAALEKVGGECNAFTNTDITNYYISLPAVNLETAFWLESDRMLHLNLSPKTIETQRKVVIEEFKQRYLNQPYGNAFHLVRDLAFDTHPYQWPTIGRDIDDIENYQSQDVEEFYFTHYRPDNAVMVVAGDVTLEQVKHLSKKWFGDIPSGNMPKKSIPKELPQISKKSKTVMEEVPTDALYKVYHVPGRLESGYLEADLITDILGFGRSSFLEHRLVKNSDLFATVSGYVLGNVDPGLMVFTGKMEKGRTAEEAEKLLDETIAEFIDQPIPEPVLQKVKNQAEAMKTYETVQLLNRAMSLAYYAHLGNPDLYQTEYVKKTAISGERISEAAKAFLREENATVLYYKSNT
ncbi:M16 family metallopeptidase [Pararhodonellum marinum]|uniref:M16 family metallopeptidase n=1 Tax=Pararhodonellum marinum TaxID=2755358 RepID=UPI00188F3FB6|nr:pitrilysin family protein [Pararhodonellum marinum]